MKRNKERAFLFMEDSHRVYRCQLTKDLTIIGKSDDNDIVIRDLSIQPHHARITAASDVYTLRSIDESEVYIGGQPIESPHELENGNVIEIGDAHILFAREHWIAPTPVHLIVRQQGLAPMGFWSHRSTIVIGREKGDVILNDQALSSVHTIIENFCPGGQFVLDARSESGTSLNGELIQVRRRLKDGDMLLIGDTEIEFRSQPFEDKTAQDAVKLAAERIAALRAMDKYHSGETEPAPRNPTPAQNSRQRVSKHREARLGGTGQIAAPSPRHSRKRRRGDRRGMDLKSGIKTGFADGARQSTNASLRQRRLARKQHNNTEALLPSESAPSRPKPTYQGEPRTESQKRHFENRSELDTKLNLGSKKKQGLWYLPDKDENEHPSPPLKKPIIKARGDEMPMQNPQSISENKQRPPRTRRPPSGVHAIHATQTSPVTNEPSRYSPEPPNGPQEDINSGSPFSNTPGARPAEDDRWYIPAQTPDGGRARPQSADRPWYMPNKNAAFQGNKESDKNQNKAHKQQGTVVIEKD